MTDEEKLSNRLYVKISLIIFILFIAALLIVSVITGVFMLTPLRDVVGKGFAVTTFFTIIAIYGASAILSSFITYFAAKRVFKPLVELSNESMKVAKGDFNVRVEENSSIPELKETQHNFNLMVKELSKVETLSNDFVSNVSHEFKTPLSVIRSYVNILENTELTEEERTKCLKQINLSTEKLSTLISNVLKICKLDNQEVSLEKKNYRLDEQIRQCILSFRDTFENKEINLDLELDDCLINADEALLNQIWINLLSNALKFTPEKGTISINLKVLENTAVVFVKDTGVGMSEETKHHIFDRFYQGDTSHTKDGNGLGLTIVLKIVKLCGGKITVESEENKGSTFMVSLPLK